MKPALRIAASVPLLALAMFCAFGFAATYEPMEPGSRATWRIIYALAGLFSLAALGLIHRRRTGPGRPL